jgi:hypothetical protein
MQHSELDITQTSDFYCLLELMVPLYQIDEYAALPELFSIIGHEKLIRLMNYAGGETIRIPTIDELNHAIEALDWYYNVYVTERAQQQSIPEDCRELVNKIKEALHASNN